MRLLTTRSLKLRRFNEKISDDTGVSIVEIVVSVLLLGLLAIAFLPFLVTSLKISVANVATVTATEVIAEHIDTLRNNAQDCSTLQTRASSLSNSFITNQGQELTLVSSISECSDDDHSAVVTFEAFEDGASVIQVTSQILVGVGS